MSKIIGYCLCAISGAVIMLLGMRGCMSQQEKALAKNLQSYKDSTAASQKKVAVISVSYDSLKKNADTLHITLIKHDSAFRFKIDSISKRFSSFKDKYYSDTNAYKKTLIRLLAAYNAKDTSNLKEIIDSLIIESRSANWAAQNLFYDCEQRDSIWRSQKVFDDSVIDGYRIIDSSKDVKFNNLLFEYNSLQGVSGKQQNDLEKYAILLKKAQSANIKWGIVGLILGIGTNFLHK